MACNSAGWGKNHYLSNGYDVGPTRIWESDDNRFVIRLPIRKKDRKKDWVVLHAWATIHVVEDQVSSNPQDCRLKEIRLEKVDWDAESKNLFVNTLAWLAHEPLRKVIESAGKRPLDGLEAKLKQHSTQTYEDGVIKTGFSLKTHKFQDLTAQGGFLRVAFHLTGEPTLDLK